MKFFISIVVYIIASTVLYNDPVNGAAAIIKLLTFFSSAWFLSQEMHRITG